MKNLMRINEKHIYSLVSDTFDTKSVVFFFPKELQKVDSCRISSDAWFCVALALVLRLVMHFALDGASSSFVSK